MSTEHRLKVLLVYPETPDSYWKMTKAVGFVGARSVLPPLPLITVAALFPEDWPMRLVDENIGLLTADDLVWADIVMVTGMTVHSDSMHKILVRCKARGVPTLVGGPYVSTHPENPEFEDATSLVTGELEDEGLIDEIVDDLIAGTLKSRYAARGQPKMCNCLTPRFDLLEEGAYSTWSIQCSRGCPYSCEFCDVTKLFGKRSRFKSPDQILGELAAIEVTGYRGNIFIVDDNFIGDKKATIAILEAIRDWQVEHKYPFQFYTEADIRIATEPDLVDLMVETGFLMIFTGLESPSVEALRETKKFQNVAMTKKVDPAVAIRELRERGLFVTAGLIVGFDADSLDCFDEMVEYVERLNISWAMVGMLAAFEGTALHDRMEAEGRLIDQTGGNQFELSNIRPMQMSRVQLVRGYRSVLERLYNPEAYFDRALREISEWKPGSTRQTTPREFMAIPRSLIRQGIRGKNSWHYRRIYWRFMLRAAAKGPAYLQRAFVLATAGEHFIWYTSQVVVPALKAAEKRLLIEEAAEPQQDPHLVEVQTA